MSKWNPITPIRSLYNWTLKWSDHPKSEIYLAIFSSVEGIFFPIPVDPFLIAMGASNHKKAIRFSMIAAVASVVGGSIGYSLGFWFWESAQSFFQHYIFTGEKLELVIQKFNDNAFLAIFLAGFTPIPYKVFAIAAGIAKINIPIFLLGSLLGRSLRFLVIGIMLYKWGPEIRVYIEKHFNRLTYGLGGFAIFGYIVYKVL